MCIRDRLVINQAMLTQSVHQAGVASGDVTAGLDAFMTLTRDIQDLSLIHI